MRISTMIGWGISGLLALMLIGASAVSKFTQWEGKDEMFDQLGWTPEVMFNVGIVEVIVTLLFLIPRTSFVGAILLTGYLGGATATQVRVGDPFITPVIVGVLVWVALGLRRPGIFTLAMGNQVTTEAVDQPS